MTDSDAQTRCASCDAPLLATATFCKNCGFDAVENRTEDSYLDGTDLPQGYGATDPAEPIEPRAKAGVRDWIRFGAIVVLLLVLLPLALSRLMTK